MRCPPLVLLCLVVYSRLLVAQSGSVSLSGRVTDTSGASVVGADVEAIRTGTDVSNRTRTNNLGDFTFSSLPPGEYRLVIVASGFRQSVTEGIVLHVQDRVAQNVVLQVGAVNEVVQVTEHQLLNTEDAAVGTVVERQFLANMPLNGRSFQSLITLTPGAVTVAARDTAPGQFVVNGQRSDTNYFTVDGLSANVAAPIAGSLGANGTGTTPTTSATGGFNNMVSIDALEEFRISTSSFAPEFGRTSGGQVSLVTRSGTNSFHGDVFDYLRNTVLDANDWFLNAASKPRAVVQQNDFGGVLGGPIIKNKLFFFGSYEGLRLNAPSPGRKPVPTQAARTLAAATNDNGVVGYMAQFLNAYPLPDGNPSKPCTSAVSCQANYTASFPGTNVLDAGSGRIDYDVSKQVRLFGRYNRSPSSLTSVNTVDSTALQIGADSYTAGWTYAINTALTNDARFNFTHTTLVTSVNPIRFKGDLSAIFPSGYAQPPSAYSPQQMQIRIGGFQPAGVDTFVLAPAQVNNGNDQYNITETLSLTTGSHGLKFGADYRVLMPAFDQANFNWNNQFRGENNCPGSTPAYICGIASTSNIQHNVPQHFRFRQYSFFGQDTWKATLHLTLTYGVRWEINPAAEYTNGYPGFSISKSSFNVNDLTTYTLNPLGTPAFATGWHNFSPRLGLAYELSDHPNWSRVLRFGYGIFYDTGTQPFSTASAPWNARCNNKAACNTPPFTGPAVDTVQFPVSAANVRFVSPPVIPNPPSFPLSLQQDFLIDPNYQLPYVHQVNVSFEQQLGAEQSLTLSYVGAVARRLFGQLLYPPNKSNPAVLGNGKVGDTLWIYGNYSTSDYHSLQAKLQRQFRGGLGVVASYTWSHSVDDLSQDAIALNPFLPTAPVLASTGRPYIQQRANSDFDIRHNLAFSVVYEIPAASMNGVAKALLGHWAVAPIYHYQTAVPIDIVARTDSSLAGATSLSQRPNLIPGVPIYVTGSTCAAQYLQALGLNGCPGGRALNIAPVSDALAAQAGCSAPAINVAKGAFCTPLPVGTQAVSGNFGRNIVRAFPLQEFDLSLQRDFPIHESIRLRFQADMFNVFNHPVFGPPGSNVSASAFGLASTMANSGLGPDFSTGSGFNPLYNTGGPRNFQFALKLFF